IVGFKNHGDDDAKVRICVRKKMGDICVDISAPGKEVDLGALNQAIEEDDFETERAVRAIVLKAHGKNFKYSYKDGTNYVTIAAGKAEKSSLIATFVALVLGLALGIIASTIIPDKITNAMCTYALDPVKTMFMNALKIIVGPVVFFSIVTCLSQFKDLSELGRIGAKVMGMYIMTTIIAAMLAFLFSYLIQPGQWGAGLGTVAAGSVDVDTNVETGLLHTIINIVPDNFVKPFLESDTLQLIFLAVICGVAVSMLGQHSKLLSRILEACNDLFLTITTIIARFIPVAVFCSVALLIIQLGGETLLSLLSMCGTFFACIACMMLVYCLLILIIANLNPLVFFKKAWEGIITSFALSSSSAAMPTNMRICNEKLGISPKLTSFSIPLGATVNMDGATMNLIVMALFLARMYGVSLSLTTIGSMAFTVIMLSLGAPGVPGAGLVCLGIILEHIGVPIEAMGLIIAINPFLDMFATMNNTTGDMAVSTIIAKREKMIDKEIYYKS
ncbi:MAG: dicarboxylate/amino acid:cation symporter, partial [Eubacterium sp.]|nr:dicarboxylate/amino acid:cation symporter [Eubacterium sp.]